MFFAGRDLTVGNTVSATAVVVWIHGLGDTPDGWGQQMAKLAPALPHVRFELPLAPTQPVACNGGMAMTSWMDLEAIPIDIVTSTGMSPYSTGRATFSTIRVAGGGIVPYAIPKGVQVSRPHTALWVPAVQLATDGLHVRPV